MSYFGARLVHPRPKVGIPFVLALLSLASFPAGAQDGQIITTPRNIVDDPTMLSPPIVDPIYDCAVEVSVEGFVYGAQIVVSVNGSPQPAVFGTHLSGEIVPLTAPLAPGDVVTATQQLGATISSPSDPVVVGSHTADFPGGLPRSRLYPYPLWQCGRIAASRGHLAGAHIKIYSETFLGGGTYDLPVTVGERDTAHDWSYTYIDPAFIQDARITTDYSVCADTSPLSYPEFVQPEPAPMPVPHVDPVYEGQKIVRVKNVLMGALVELTMGGNPAGADYVQEAHGVGNGTDVNLSPPAIVGQQILATQKLCTRSGPGDPTVQPCSALPAPIIRDPEAGDTILVILSSPAPDARIRVYVETGGPYVKIGDGGGDRIHLTRPIGIGETIVVTAAIDSCVSLTAYRVGTPCKKERVFFDASLANDYGVGVAEYSLPPETIGGEPNVRILASVRYPVKLGDGPNAPVVPWGSKLPLVIFLHGNHARWVNGGSESCDYTSGATEIRSDLGYVFAMEALARRGFIAVSIDANDLNCLIDRIPQRAALILRHLAQWKTFDDATVLDPVFNGKFYGRVDYGRTGLIGHSRGGEAVVKAAIDNADPDINIRAVLSVAPTDVYGSVLNGIPYVVLLPAADGDLAANDGARIYDRWVSPASSAFKSQLYIYGANHNFFNSRWLNDDDGGLSPARLTRPEQENMLRAWSVSLMELWLGYGSANRAVFAKDAVIAGLKNDVVYPSFEAATEYVLDRYIDHPGVSPNSAGGPVSSFSTVIFNNYPFAQTGGAYNPTFFHQTVGTIESWNQPTANWHSGFTAPTDLSAFRFLEFRTAQVNDPINGGTSNMHFDVGLSDTAHNGRISTQQIGPIPPPYHTAHTTYKTMLRTLRVPMACLQDPNRSLVDPTQVVGADFFSTPDIARGMLGYSHLSFSN